MGKHIVFQSHTDLEAQVLDQGPEGVHCSSQHIVIWLMNLKLPLLARHLHGLVDI